MLGTTGSEPVETWGSKCFLGQDMKRSALYSFLNDKERRYTPKLLSGTIDQVLWPKF